MNARRFWVAIAKVAFCKYYPPDRYGESSPQESNEIP